jgi:hypothetical protein
MRRHNGEKGKKVCTVLLFLPVCHFKAPLLCLHNLWFITWPLGGDSFGFATIFIDCHQPPFG